MLLSLVRNFFCKSTCLVIGTLFALCSADTRSEAVPEKLTDSSTVKNQVTPVSDQKKKPAVTFVELGSDRCIPCRMMQPVLKNIKEKYGSQVDVVFHDVWTEEGKIYGEKYNIVAIPTQVFIDSDGKEYFRHEGFFAEEDVVKVLKQKIIR